MVQIQTHRKPKKWRENDITGLPLGNISLWDMKKLLNFSWFLPGHEPDETQSDDFYCLLLYSSSNLQTTTKKKGGRNSRNSGLHSRHVTARCRKSNGEAISPRKAA
ncbi:hypothetical protein RvY_11318 [Ramazzottius varieornatus]|uniref:Uncharacterized protein n=1 Tax=Ramazzottius varieornatus TaxID=947166 RepID=A0A1D1VFR4_RAMVA|nr:hypothetical protein RvY_11318 [Ramazzottius varieornatus]